MTSIPNELIFAIKAQIDGFIRDMDKAGNAYDKFKKRTTDGMTVGEVKQSTLKAFGDMSRYYKMIGDSAGLANEKSSYLSNTIRTLTRMNTPEALKLAESFVRVKTNIDATAASAQKLAQIKLAKEKGLTGIFDTLTGGKVSQATGQLKMLGQAFGFSEEMMTGLLTAAGPVALGIAALGLAWKNVIGPGIAFNAMLEQQEVGFRVMLGSAEKAARMMVDLRDLTMTTPIGFAEGAQGAKQLMAYGFAQNEIIKNMKLIGTLASATGSSVNELVYVYGTLRAQGQAYTRDLMQFGMRGIPIYEYLAKTLGVSVREIKGMTEAGKIGYNEVRVALEAMTGEGGRFNNMLEEQMKTLKGLQTILKNTADLVRGEVAASWEDVAKGYTAATIPMTKAAGSLFTPFSDMLAGLAKAFKPFYDFLVIVVQYWAIIVESIKAAFRLLGNLLKPITDVVGGFLSWLDPLGRITRFLEGALDKIKKIGKETMDVPLPTYERAKYDISGATDPKVIKAVGDIVYRMKHGMEEGAAIIGRQVNILPETVARWQNEFIALNDGATYSFGEALNYVLTRLKSEYGDTMGQVLYDSLMEKAPILGNDFWTVFVRSAPKDSLEGLMDSFFDKGMEGALAYTDQWDTAIAAIRKSQTEMGISAETIKSKVKSIASEGFESVYASLLAIRAHYGDPTKYVGQLKIFWDELVKKLHEYEQATEGERKKEKQANYNLLDYMKLRADYMNAESAFISKRLAAETQLSEEMLGGTISQLQRQYALNQYQYKLDLKELQTKYKAGELTLKQWSLEVKIAGIKKEQADEAVRLADIEAKRVAKLTRGQEMYKLQLGDNAAYWEELEASMGRAADVGDYASYAGMTAINATQGTEVGNMIAGGIAGDPITMALKAFADMLMSIENVGKVLNPFKTALEGTKAIIEGPLNSALKPLVDALTVIGETLGVILLPIIDLLADQMGALFGWIKPVMTIFNALYKALSPLIKLFFQLMNPIYFLFDILNQLFTALGAVVEATAGQAADLEDLYDQQVKSLQDLYEVGAISGQEYERRLAMLRAGTEVDSPFMAGVETSMSDLFASIAKLVAIIQKVMNLLDPLLAPILDALLIVMQFLIDLLTPIINLVALIAALFTGDSELVKSMAQAFWDSLVKWWTNTWTNIGKFFIDLWNKIIIAFNKIFGTNAPTIPTDQGSGGGMESARLAVGASSLPNDMIAQVHKGEMVVPRTFADSIRNGDVSLSGPRGSSSGTTVININVEGSVTTERDLVKTIGTELTKLRKLGYA